MSWCPHASGSYTLAPPLLQESLDTVGKDLMEMSHLDSFCVVTGTGSLHLFSFAEEGASLLTRQGTDEYSRVSL